MAGFLRANMCWNIWVKNCPCAENNDAEGAPYDVQGSSDVWCSNECRNGRGQAAIRVKVRHKEDLELMNCICFGGAQ
jgi:hypothetical protein